MSKLKRAFGKRFLALVLSGAMIMSNMTVSAAELSSGVTEETSIEDAADNEVVVHSEESSDESDDDKESTEESSTVEESTTVEETKVEESKTEESTVEESKTEESKTKETTTAKESSKPATQSDEVDYSQGFEIWFAEENDTSISQGTVGGENSPVYAGIEMTTADSNNSIEVDGKTYYAVKQKTTNPSPGSGKIPTSGAYIKVTAPADGTITVYTYKADTKPFYVVDGDGTILINGDATNYGGAHGYMVEVTSGKDYYFYASGSKAQFVGVVFELPKASHTISLELKGESLGTAKITFTNDTTGTEVSIGKDDTEVTLTESYTYSVSIDSGNLTIDTDSVDLTGDIPEKITITVSEAATHKVSGSFQGLPSGATVTKLVYTDESGAATEATVNNGKYTINLKNGKYTASATVTGADGYEVYDHVKVEGTEGEDISNDVWFYAPETTYSSTYVSKITVGAKGDYKTINEAVAAATAMTRGDNDYVTIELLDSDYEEQVIINTPNIKLVAADGVEPTIHWYYGIGYKYYSIDGSVTNKNGTVDLGYYSEKCANDKYEMYYADKWGTVVRLNSKATGFIAEGITFKNTFNIEVVDAEIGDSKVGTNAEYGQSISGSLQERKSGLDVANTTNVERAAAMVVDCDEAEFYGCTFISSQDTLYTGSANSYYNDCTIVGQTDYIFGNTGTSAIFDNCELRWLGYTGTTSKEGYITATRGTYLFRGCTITKNTADGYTVKAGYFGRPWGNAATVYFVGTSIADDTLLNAAGWYNMSGVNPEDATFREYGNTVGKDKTNFYSTYAANEKDGDAKFQLTKTAAETLADPANDSTFLGTWTPVHHITSALDLTSVADWFTAKGEEETETPDEGKDKTDVPTTTETKTYTFEAKDLTAFDKGTKADGDSEKAGTDNFFTLLYSANTKVDSSSKTFEDGYESGQRVNFGGIATTEKNAIKFTTEGTATVKVWWAEGGDDNRQIAILNESGTEVTATSETLTKNAVCISKLTLDEAGTYYLGSKVNNNYIFKVEIVEEVKVELVPVETTYTIETKDLTAFDKGAKADGDSEKAGTDNFFTLLYSANTKVDSSSKTFEDGYESGQRVNFGGIATTEKNAIKFTTEGSATVKVWWAEGGDDNRQIAILNESGTEVAATSETLTKNAVCISKLTLDEAGTYYLGSKVNNNYIFKVEVTVTTYGAGSSKPARAEWSDVVSPVIKSVALNSSNKANVDVTVGMVIGYDGADKIAVDMYNADGELVATRNSLKEGEEVTVSFTPDASGNYTFKVTASRDDVEEVKVSEMSEPFAFTYLLAAPLISSITSLGDGDVKVVWGDVKEATGYEVTYYIKDNKPETITENTSESGVVTVTATEDGELATETTLKGLATGNIFTFEVVALRKGTGVDGAVERSEATTENRKVVADKEREWAYTAYGASISLDHKKDYYELNEDGSVRVWSKSNAGKIVPASSGDGLSVYYTKLDSVNDNFVFEADVHVNEWTYSNGQEGFGLIVADRIGEYTGEDNSNFWNNSYMAVSTKIQYRWDKENGKVTTDGEIPSTTMYLGIGTLVRKGVPYGWSGTSMPTTFSATSDSLEFSAGKLYGAGGSYNLIGNRSNSSTVPTIGDGITDLKLRIVRDNTGYTISYIKKNDDGSDGKVVSELYYDQKYFDGEYNNLTNGTLTQMDPENLYVGFFTARNADVTFSNISLTVTNAADDEPAKDRENTLVDPYYSVISASTANSADYDFTFYSNAQGTLTLMDSIGKVIDTVRVGEVATEIGDSDETVTRNSKVTIPVTLSSGKNTFTWTMTPDEDVKVTDKYTYLNSYEPKTGTFTVTYNKLGGSIIYVSPNATSKGTGTSSSPMLITEAVKYAAPGQTIILMEGTYKLTSSLSIPRGVDGTKENPIYMIADPNANSRPVIDFCNVKGAGMTMSGNYWYFKGFDVTRSGDGTKGITLTGDYNTLDQINAYRNGNTGIQLSRLKATDETKEDWPKYNTILNCTSYLNADSGYEDADGFAAKLTVGDGNVFDGCVAAYNADDGWDLYAKVETGAIGVVTIKNCVAYKNGYDLKINDDGTVTEIDAGNGNGFKLGGANVSGKHELINCVAFNNKAKGIDSNSGPDIHVTNCISFDNESYNVALYTGTGRDTDYEVNGVISFRKYVLKDSADKLLTEKVSPYNQDETKIYKDSNYYWDSTDLVSKNKSGATVSENWFESLVTPEIGTIIGVDSSLTGKAVPRTSTGALNLNGLLQITANAPESVQSYGLGTSEVSKGTDEIISDAKDNAANITMAIDEIENQVYTGSAIKPTVVVKSGANMLTKNDYTITYSNNINVGEATVTITGKGNYATTSKITRTFKIEAKSIEDPDVYVVNESLATLKEGTKPSVTVKWNNKTLSRNRNYTITYYGLDDYTQNGVNGTKLDSCAGVENGKYVIVVAGINNYEGTKLVNYTVVKDKEHSLANAKITYPKTMTATGKAVEFDADSLVVKSYNGTLLHEGEEYTVSYRDNDVVGRATVIVTGKGDYAGEKQGYFTIQAINISTVVKEIKMSGYDETTGDDKETALPSSVEFAGGSYEFNRILLKAKDSYLAKYDNASADLVYDDGLGASYISTEYYDVSYKNNTKAGTATLVITGKNKYTGKITKTFRIKAYNMKDHDITDDYNTLSTKEMSTKTGIIVEGLTATYMKGAVKPDDLTVSYFDQGVSTPLTLGKDYTVSYRNNNPTSLAAALKNPPTVVITGKGGYTGVMTAKQITVNPEDFSAKKAIKDVSCEMSITVADKFATRATKSWVSAVTVKDLNGKTLSGTGKNADYTVAYTFTDSETNKHENLTAKEAAKFAVNPNTVITVTVTATDSANGSGFYTGSKVVTYQVLPSSQNISKAKVTQSKTNLISYTGEAITLDAVVNKEASETTKPLTITLKVNGKDEVLKLGTDYEVVSGTYKNNIKKGTASVTIRGIGNYGGTKTVSYRISAKILEDKVVDSTEESTEISTDVAPEVAGN